MDIATLKGEVLTATKKAAKDSELIEVYRKQTGDAKMQEREMAKVNAREKQRERDEIRQNKKFSKSTDG